MRVALYLCPCRKSVLFSFFRVQAGSDCGFATFGKLPTVHPDIVWAKLQAMAEGADIAAQQSL